MSDQGWHDVDAYIGGRLLPPDPILDDVLEANGRAGLPPIDVSPAQGKMLHLMARMRGARRILEIGTLGGYSTIWLARALPGEGTVVSLEFEPRHAEVARKNLAAAGVADRVEIRVGLAVETLARLYEEGVEPFDFIFIDADKESNAAYLAWALKLSRLGTVIVADNVVRSGQITDPDSADSRVLGTQRFFESLASEPRLSATAIQTVGAKGWDGFALAIVT